MFEKFINSIKNKPNRIKGFHDKIRNKRRKPRSRKRMMQNERKAKSIKKNSKKDLVFEDLYQITIQSYNRKQFSGFFLNRLEVHKKSGKSGYLKQVEEIVPGLSVTQKMEGVQSMLILTLIALNEHIKSLSDVSFLILIVSNRTELTKDFELETSSKMVKRIYVPKGLIKQKEIDFHPKLILIKFQNHIQMIMGTGNFLKFDWEDYANAGIVKILPKKQGEERSIDEEQNRFKMFLDRCLGKYKELLNDFLEIDILQYTWNFRDMKLLF